MATLSESDYSNLLPYKSVIDMFITHGIYVGCDIHAFKKIYEPLANEVLNISCGACISNALRRANDLMKEYENGST